MIFANAKIALETKKGNSINNCQSLRLSAFMASQKVDLRKYSVLAVRSEPTGMYNCHGLVFASRRTCIHEDEEILKILRDDEYEEVELRDVIPGDIVIYTADNGDKEHSGIVVGVSKERLSQPLIISKWNCSYEVLHYASQSPYDASNLKYYRITK